MDLHCPWNDQSPWNDPVQVNNFGRFRRARFSQLCARVSMDSAPVSAPILRLPLYRFLNHRLHVVMLVERPHHGRGRTVRAFSTKSNPPAFESREGFTPASSIMVILVCRIVW